MENFQLLRKFQQYVAGCSSCNVLWFKQIPPKDIFWELGIVIVELNQRHACIGELHAQDIHITHGICAECIARSATAEKIRRKQLEEGHFDCFGTANHGYCDQYDCKYRKLCVWDERSYPTKRESLTFLYAAAA